MIEGIENLLPAREIEAFESALTSFPQRAIRLRVDRRTEDIPFPLEPVPWLNSGYWVTDPQARPGGCLAFAAADYYIQDAASFLPVRLLDVQPDDRVCDVCAAPGGKGTAIAERLGPQGFLVANEAIQSRLDVLRYNLARTGRMNYTTSHLDPDDLALRCNHLFNKVIVDVPCSGQSLFGKGKHDTSAFRPGHIAQCAARARRILLAASRMLEPDGLLVFSTCTFSVEENESQIEWLMNLFPGAWEPWTIPDLEPWQSTIRPGCYRLWPHRDRCSGGFAAALRKVADTPAQPMMEGVSTESRRSKSDRKIDRSRVARDQEELRTLIGSIGDWGCDYQIDGNCVTAQEPGVRAFLDGAVDRSCFQPATVAWMARQHSEPMHALAMANSPLFVPHRETSLSDVDAGSFVTGNSIRWSGASKVTHPKSETTPWVRALWRGKPLGWLKESSQRWNNHLPAWARINLSS